MVNKVFFLSMVLIVGLGCGIVDRVKRAAGDEVNSSVVNTNSNKSLTDTAVDTAVGEKKVGIAECDEAIEILASQANDPDDNFVTKAVKKTALNTFREQLAKNLEENKTDKKEVAKFCKEFRDNLSESVSNSNSSSNSNTSNW